MNENPNDEYIKAMRLGKKKYHKLISQGKSGFLLSMEDQFPIMESTSEVNLGLEKVPLHKIIGTWSRSRANLFTQNFLPLAPPDKSEFAGKWKALYQSHIEIGINEPVKLYEYMNWYYVVEGNKRVSVLNFVDAFSVDAIVIRLLPGRNPMTEVKQIYFGFIDFKRKTSISEIWITRNGGFKILIDKLQDYAPVFELSGEEQYDHFLRNLYRPFRKLFHLLEGQNKLRMTTGDAFLRYIEIFNFSSTFIPNKEKMVIARLIEELIVEENDNNSRTITDGIKEDKIGIKQFYSRLNSNRKQVKVLFLYARDVEKSGWSYAHEKGRLEAQNLLGDRIYTYSRSKVPENDNAYKIIEEEVIKGADVIFSTSPFFGNATLKAAIQFPDTLFYTCSSSHSHKRMRTYFGQSFESSFLTGVLAALIDKEGQIGYIASNSGIERYARINGFVNGVKLIHPKSTVALLWNNYWDYPEHSRKLAKELLDSKCNLIFQHSLPQPGNSTGEYGLYNFSGDHQRGKVRHFAETVWNWGNFYQRVLENILTGSKGDFKGSGSGNLQFNFWGGIRSKIVDLVINEDIVPIETLRMISLIRDSLVNRQIHPFIGPIYDIKGTLRIKDKSTAGLDEIRKMDWLCDGVEEHTDIEKIKNKQ
jgi:basic membrane protein A and related proteins